MDKYRQNIEGELAAMILGSAVILTVVLGISWAAVAIIRWYIA